MDNDNDNENESITSKINIFKDGLASNLIEFYWLLLFGEGEMKLSITLWFKYSDDYTLQ